MVKKMKHPKLLINYSKLLENYNYYRTENETIICVVKSNAYGCSLNKIVSFLLNNGVQHFAVFTLKEAIQIRKLSNSCFILLLNSIEKKDLKKCQDLNITISINSILDYNLVKNTPNISVHIKIDTGMHRVGVTSYEFKEIIANKKIKITGIFSHLVGGADNICYLKRQINLFDYLLKNIDKTKYLIHICSSSSAKIIKSKYQNAIRIGLGLYGFNELNNPCLKIELPITYKKVIKENEYCSYNCSFKAPKKGYLYIIPTGYHNWLLPNTKIKVQDFVNAGSICMNWLILYSTKNYTKKVITLNGYDLIKICKDNNYSIYWLLSSFKS